MASRMNHSLSHIIKVSNMQLFKYNRKLLGQGQVLNIFCRRSLRWTGEQSGTPLSWTFASPVLPIVL